MPEKKDIYFKKFQKDSKIIAIVKNGNFKDIEKLYKTLNNKQNWDFLVVNDNFQFIEVPEKCEIDVIPYDKYPKKEKLLNKIKSKLFG